MRGLPRRNRRRPAVRVAAVAAALAATLSGGVAAVLTSSSRPGAHLAAGFAAAADRPRSPAEAVPGLAEAAGGFREPAAFRFTVAVTATGAGSVQTVRGAGSYSSHGPTAELTVTLPGGTIQTLRAVGARVFVSVPVAGLTRTRGRHWLGFPRPPVTDTGDLLGLLADNPLDLLGAFQHAPRPTVVGPTVLGGLAVVGYQAETDTGPLGPASYLVSLAGGVLRAFTVSFTSPAGVALQVSVTVTATGAPVAVPLPPSSDVQAEDSEAAALAVLDSLR